MLAQVRGEDRQGLPQTFEIIPEILVFILNHLSENTRELLRKVKITEKEEAVLQENQTSRKNT